MIEPAGNFTSITKLEFHGNTSVHIILTAVL